MKKDFDCVEMKHKGAAILHEKLKNLTDQEKLAYFRQADKKLKERIKQAKAQVFSK